MQSVHLGDVRALLARAYVTGNHEYFGEAEGWLYHMRELGWEPLHNRHLVLERNGDVLPRGWELANQAVVDLLEPLAEPGLHDAVERLAPLDDRDDRPV